MKGKAGKVANWLPNQVVYGIDCSEPDPEQWQHFGSDYDARQESEKHSAVKAPSKSGLPTQ